MTPQKRNRWIIWGSALLGVAGFIVGLVRTATGHSFGLLPILLLSYGGVFIFVVPMNWIGQQAARLRQEQDEEAVATVTDRPRLPHRPRSTAGGGGAKLALQAPYVRVEHVRLERVTEDTADRFQALLDESVTEVLALQDIVPDIAEDHHLQSFRVDALLNAPHVFLFFIEYQSSPIGTIVMNAADDLCWVEMLYVQSAWRQRGIARCAYEQLMGFVSMLHANPRIVLPVDASNARGGAFAAAIGLRPMPSDAAGVDDTIRRFLFPWPHPPSLYFVRGADDSN